MSTTRELLRASVRAPVGLERWGWRESWLLPPLGPDGLPLGEPVSAKASQSAVFVDGADTYLLQACDARQVPGAYDVRTDST